MIDFIAANNGKIELYSRNRLIGLADTAITISSFLKEFGFDGYVGTSSSIDFADEYGFKNYDSAYNLFHEAVELFYEN